MAKQVTITPILESRYNLSSEKKTVRLRITHNRKSEYFSLKIYLTDDEFEQVMSIKPGRALVKVRNLIDAERLRAEEIINDMAVFNFLEFKLRYKSDTGKVDFFKRMGLQIENLRSEGREKYAISFDTTLNSIKAFWNKDTLMIEDIDLNFLKKYEKWMLDNGKSKTTLGIYLRNVRTIFNQEIAAKNVSAELYPFGKSKSKFKIPSGSGIKKFLEKEEIKLLYYYELEQESNAQRYRDYWFFIYLCNGLNVKDMAMLKYKNIDAGRILFVREKTKNTTRDHEVLIEVPIINEVSNIITRWGNKHTSSETYIFPILKEGLSPRQVIRRVEDTVSNINATMKIIAEKTGVTKNVTTYVARHTFATMLKREGFSVEFIQEALGHTDARTTRSYLGSFGSEVKSKAAEKLLSFNN